MDSCHCPLLPISQSQISQGLALVLLVHVVEVVTIISVGCRSEQSLDYFYFPSVFGLKCVQHPV